MNETDFFKHHTAIVDSTRIGRGTRIWAFCNVQKGASVGADCNICDHCFLENGVIVGDRVTVKNGVSLWDGVTIEDDVFIGPNAVFTNDILPRSRVPMEKATRTKIKKGATIGANAAILAGHTIGQYAFIGAGAVVTKDVPDYSLWYGNPARMVGFVCRCARRLELKLNRDDQMQNSATCECGLRYRFENNRLILDQ